MLKCRAFGYGTFLNAMQRFAGPTVEDEVVATLITVADRRRAASASFQGKQDCRLGAVVVPDVVMDFLEMPPIAAGIDVERDDGCGQQIVAFAIDAVQVWSC